MATETECFCSDEGPCEQHCTVLAQRNGAASRTADELCLTFLSDADDIRHDALTDEDRSVWRDCEADLERQRQADPIMCGWLDDPDLADALRDVVTSVESALSPLWTIWDDGYIIVRVHDDCPLLDA